MVKGQESRRKVKLRDVTLGSGRPALILPLVPRDREELRDMAQEAAAHRPDLFEWRADYFEAVEDREEVAEALRILRAAIGNGALLVTPRHAKENGVREISPERKEEFFRWVAESRLADMVDVELRYGGAYIGRIRRLCQENGTALMVSYHDLEKTPGEEEIREKMREEEAAGADVCKVSFLAQGYGDIWRLGRAVRNAKREEIAVPVVSISAGPLGTLSRIGAEAFGSDGTFVSVGRTHQIHIDDLRILRSDLGLEEEKEV